MRAAPKSKLGLAAPEAAHFLLASHWRDVEFMFHAGSRANEAVYTRLAYHSRDPFLTGLLFSQRVVA